MCATPRVCAACVARTGRGVGDAGRVISRGTGNAEGGAQPVQVRHFFIVCLDELHRHFRLNDAGGPVCCCCACAVKGGK